MERTISEKHLLFLNKRPSPVRSQNKDQFLYGTIRKLPQKGTVRVLADKYDKYSRPPLNLVKQGETPKMPERGVQTITSRTVRKFSSSGEKGAEKFSTFKDEKTKDQRLPLNEIRFASESDTFYSLESSPLDRKEGNDLSDPERIPNQPLPEIIANLDESLASRNRRWISNSKAKDDIAVLTASQYDSSAISGCLQPRTIRPKLSDFYDMASKRQTVLVPSKISQPLYETFQLPSVDKSANLSLGVPSSFKESVPKVERENNNALYGEAIAVDKMKSEKADSDDEEASYFHVLLIKNRDNFSTLPKIFKTQSQHENNDIILSRRSTYRPLLEPSNITKDHKDWFDRNFIAKRKFMLTNIINSEKNYVALLEVISQYKHSFEKSLCPSTCLTPADVDILFKDCLLLLERHNAIVKSISAFESRLNKNNDILVGKLILELAISEFEIGKRYLTSYPDVVKLLQQLMKNEARFRELTKNVCLTNLADVKLEDLLFKPIFQLQKNISMWSDLFDVTPEDHPDYKALVEVSKLSESFLIQINTSSPEPIEERLLMQGVMVEKGSKSKKLVKLFLFREVLVCTKEKISHGLNVNRVVRWFIPLSHVKLEKNSEDLGDCQSALKHENELNDLQQELIKLQLEYQSELQNSVDNRSMLSQSLMNRKVDSLQKKIEKQEVLLSLSLPILPLIVTNMLTKKSFHLLISSHYDQAQWAETILEAVNKASNSSKLSLSDVTAMVNTNKLVSSKSHNAEQPEYKDQLTGSLNIIIHKVIGLKEKSRVSCTIETDFLGHYLMKEQTNAVESKEPEWNESFDVDLDGVKMLRILAYKKGKVDVLLGKCTLELDREWLSDNTTLQNLMLSNELQLLVSLKFSPYLNMRRKVTMPHPGGMFGVSLKKITKREGVLVPSIIKYCITEIESRGMVELGLYRVSGLMTEVNKIKASFDSGDVEKSLSLLKKADINVIASLLKLFLRELPEALFTDSRYSDFMAALEVTDVEKQSELFINLFKGLPSCNSASIFYILKHILRVSVLSQFNKMPLENLATIFGPTLLRPTIPDASELCEHKKIARETYCVTRQANVLLFYLRNIQRLMKSKWQLMEQSSFRLL